MGEIIALLDKPSSQSMGAVPFVVRASDGGLSVSGLANKPHRPVSATDLEDLLESNQAVTVGPTQMPAISLSNPIAMWIGRDFSQKALEHGIQPPPFPNNVRINTADGDMSIGNPQEVHARLEAWLEKAFRHAIKASSAPIARMMSEVMPDHELTRAALWHSASDLERSRHLAWWVRLERDSGHSVDARKLERQLKRLCDSPPGSAVKVVVLVVGHTGTKHGKVAEALIKSVLRHQYQASLVSFGGFLRGVRPSGQTLYDLIRGKRSDADVPELQDLGQQRVLTAPYHFARQVIAADEPRALLVVDGVRHRVILDAIQFMHDARSIIYGVEAPEQLIFRRLAVGTHGERDMNDIRRIREHPAEAEVHALLEQAEQVIRFDESDRLNGAALETASNRVIRELAAAG